MYRFKLQALLNHRLHQEEICQQELADAQRELSAAQEKLRHLKKNKRENVQILQARQRERHNPSGVLIYMKYIEQIAAEVETQRNQVNQAFHDVRHKREELITVVKKRKTLEKLKENENLAYQQKMIQVERKFNDEVAAVRHIRKSSMGGVSGADN